MLSGRKKKDYEAEQAAESLASQAERFGDAPDALTPELAPEAEGLSADDDEGEESDDEAVAA
jgi:hypothetical protein